MSVHLLATALSLGRPMFGPIPLQRYCGNMHFLQLIMLISWSLQVMLSSVQAYKGGYMAGQQHAWQVGFEILNYL